MITIRKIGKTRSKLKNTKNTIQNSKKTQRKDRGNHKNTNFILESKGYKKLTRNSYVKES